MCSVCGFSLQEWRTCWSSGALVFLQTTLSLRLWRRRSWAPSCLPLSTPTSAPKHHKDPAAWTTSGLAVALRSSTQVCVRTCACVCAYVRACLCVHEGRRRRMRGWEGRRWRVRVMECWVCWVHRDSGRTSYIAVICAVYVQSKKCTLEGGMGVDFHSCPVPSHFHVVFIYNRPANLNIKTDLLLWFVSHPFPLTFILVPSQSYDEWWWIVSCLLMNRLLSCGNPSGIQWRTGFPQQWQPLLCNINCELCNEIVNMPSVLPPLTSSVVFLMKWTVPAGECYIFETGKCC